MDPLGRLRARLQTMLDWYERGDAIVCPETLRNVQRDVDAIWREERERLPKEVRSVRLRASFDGARIVVRAESFDEGVS